MPFLSSWRRWSWLPPFECFFSAHVKSREAETSRFAKMAASGLIGLGIGFMAGLLGIGGGVFVVPLLIYFVGIPTRTAAASSAFIVCFSSLSGFVTHAAMVSIDWQFVLPAAVFSFAGGQIGSRIMADKLKGRSIRIVFGIVLVGFSLKLLHRALF